MHEFEIETESRTAVADVTDRVREGVPPETEGVCTAFVEHTTAGLAVNEAGPRLLDGFERALSELVADEGWAHDDLDGNADVHRRAALVGADATVPVRDGDLAPGRWRSVLPVECDGPRRRTVSATTR